MRIVATALLVVMAIIFVGAKYLETRVDENWGFLRAFAEAGMIGGLADWFAVTALFRYPLGIRIPHTAIIPNNKTRIGVTLANFLRGNFLTTKVVAKRVRHMDVAGAAGRFWPIRLAEKAGCVQAHRGFSAICCHRWMTNGWAMRPKKR